jgi:hypothetical protein
MLKLDLSNKGLYNFDEICANISIEILDLSYNNLSDLPENFNTLFPNLKILFLSNNNFTQIPICLKNSKITMLSLKNNKLAFLDNLPVTLNWFMATNNKIKNIEPLCSLKNLRKLSLSGNYIESVPDEISNLVNLELIRLSNNKIRAISGTFFRLTKMTYVALGGNPMFIEIPKKLPIVNRNSIQQFELLGSGASGKVYRCYYNTTISAIKVFHSDAGTDGLAITELNILSMLYNIDCPNLINIYAKLADDSGVIMEYIDNFKVLGNVPSFTTITRDVMVEGLDFKTVLFIAKGILSAMKVLYELKIIHGDIYAHNVLYNDNMTKLTDFGAGFYVSNQVIFMKLHKYEIRAYGNLLLDMISVCSNYSDKFLELAGKCVDGKIVDLNQIKFDEH